MSSPVPIASPPGLEPAVSAPDFGAEHGRGSADGFAALLGGLAGDAGSQDAETPSDAVAEDSAEPAATGTPPTADPDSPAAGPAAPAPAASVPAAPDVPVSASSPEEGSAGAEVPAPSDARPGALPPADAVPQAPAPAAGDPAGEAPGPGAVEPVLEVVEQEPIAPAPPPGAGEETGSVPRPGAVPVGQGVPAGQEDGEPAPSGEGNADTPASDKVPEHARAGERPGQAKEPGTPAGRPFVTGATPGGVQPAASESAAAAEPQDVAQTATEPPGEEPAPGAHSSRAHARAGAGPSDDLPSLRAAAEPASPAPAEAAPRPDAAARTTSRIAEPAPLRPRVTLAQLAEEVRAIVRLAAGGGLATARISLSPPELGQVEIRLRYRAGGVLAELSAESVQAAQALGQASSDLRRSLEQQGLIVLGLDIRHAGPEARSTAQGRDDESHPGRPQAGDGLADDAAAAEALASLTAEAGVQIDVLA